MQGPSYGVLFIRVIQLSIPPIKRDGHRAVLVTLKNGESVGGAFLKETDKEMILKTPDPDGSAEQVETAIRIEDIATKQPPVSAMPPMGVMMSQSEIRDLVAYLANLTEKKQKKGH